MAPARPSSGTNWEVTGGSLETAANAGNAHTTMAASPSMAIRVFRILTSSLAFPDSESYFGRTKLWNRFDTGLVFPVELGALQEGQPARRDSARASWAIPFRG